MSLLDDRGQSAPLGMALLLGLMLIGTTAVVAFGSTALSDTQQQSDLAKAEQTMTLFDSQTAQVALGDASVQTVNFGQAEGGYEVRPNAGEISIIQHDCNDSGNNDDSDDVVDNSSTDDDAYILSPRKLGEVVYAKDGKTIAYQGGGVWRKDDGGGSTMISPPEFHYRGATLTLPIIMTRGAGAGSGSLTARVKQGSSGAVFPHPTEEFPDASRNSGLCWEDSEPEPFVNPLTDGNVTVRIESEYADAWGRYFETRTEGDVEIDNTNDVVTIDLVSLGQIGDFDMPGSGSSVPVSGTSGGHETEEFTFTLRPPKDPPSDDNAQFSNLQWSMWVETDDDQLMEIYLKADGSDKDCSDGTTDLAADLDIYYSPDDGTTEYGWHKDRAFEAECTDYDDDPDQEIQIVVDLVDDEDGDADSGGDTYLGYTDTDEDDPELQYVSKSGMNNLNHFGVNNNMPSGYSIDGHGGEDPWEPTGSFDPDTGYTQTSDRLINHYFAELPEGFELTVEDKGSDTVYEEDSFGTLVTGGSGRYVTYLHVTRNEVEVELD